MCDEHRHGRSLVVIVADWIFGMPRGIKGVAGWRLGVEGEEWKRYGGWKLCHTIQFWTVLVLNLCL